MHAVMHMHDTHRHATVLWPFFRDQTGKPVPEEIFWTFIVQGKITEADTLTIQVGTTPSGLIIIPPHFMPDALPAVTLPLYCGLEQAPCMLACISSGMVAYVWSSGRTSVFSQRAFTVLRLACS